MRVLVIGGTGFIGRQVLVELANRGWVGVPLGRTADGIGRVDARDRPAMREFFRHEPFDAVVNLLGRIDQGASVNKYEQLVEEILVPSVHALEALWEFQNIPLVQVGSNAEYGDAPLPHAPDTLCRPTTAYGAVKLAVTNFVQAKARSEARRAHVVRPFFVYGEGAPNSNFVELIAQAAARGGSFRTSFGQQTRDMVSVRRTAQVIVDGILCSDCSATISNACTGRERTIRSVVEMAVELSNGNMIPEFGAVPYRVGELMASRGVPSVEVSEQEADLELRAYLESRILDCKRRCDCR